MKASNFLQLKIYRRTFFIYLSIVIVFFFFIISNRYKNARLAGQQFFSEHMDRAFSQVENELDGIVNTIDNFLIRLNSSSMLKKDFFIFSGRLRRNIQQHGCAAGIWPMKAIWAPVTISWQTVII